MARENSVTEDLSYEASFGSEHSLRSFAESFGECLNGGEVLALVGTLGAGKTVFSQSLARGLGVSPNVLVTSPTFVLHRRYFGRIPFDHLDTYRLNSEFEFEALGIGEIFDDNSVTVVEWADKVRSIFPPRTIWITFKITGISERKLVISFPRKKYLSSETFLGLKILKFLTINKG